jgi:drug/metabolite transporter superfamily protein YnfA
MFPMFAIWALAPRVRDPETHKRAMILAALVPIGAAFARMRWIPGNDPMTTYDVTALLELALLAPALLYDKLRNGRVHRAYWIGLALTLPWLIGAHFVWYSPAWRSFAVALMGAP